MSSTTHPDTISGDLNAAITGVVSEVYALPQTTASSTSLESISTVSTNATARDLTGTGRIIGNVYDHLGDQLVPWLNRLGQRIGLKPRDLAGTMQTGESSFDRNITAPNLVGAGRTLGLLFDFTGSILERRLSSFAENIGAGPEATARRIRDEFRRFRIMYGRNALRSASESEHVLREYLDPRSRFMSDVYRLIGYLTSDIAANQYRALYSIISLIIWDPSFSTLLNYTGASQHILYLQRQLEMYSRSDRDLLLLPSRKALLSLPDIRLNSMARDFKDVDYKLHFPMEAQTKGLQLLRSIEDPDLSFLVTRHLADSFIPGEMLLFQRELPAVLLRALRTCFSTLELDSFESLVRHCIDWILPHNHGLYGFREAVKDWKVLLGHMLRMPDKFPHISSYFLSLTSMEMLLQQTLVFKLPPFYLEFVYSALSVHFGQFRLMSSESASMEGEDEDAEITRGCAERIWNNVSSQPNQLALGILLQCFPQPGLLDEVQMVVPRGRKIWDLTYQLVCLLDSHDKEVRASVERNLKLLCTVDRYIRAAILTVLRRIPTHLERLSEAINDKKERRKLDKEVGLSTYRKSQNQYGRKLVLFRHTATVNRLEEIHIERRPMLRKLYCLTCSEINYRNGICDSEEQETPVTWDTIRLNSEHHLWLDVPPASGSTFHVSDDSENGFVHHPVLAGFTSDGQARYLAGAYDIRDQMRWSTVVEGACCAVIYDPKVMRIVEVQHFMVLVLREDPAPVSRKEEARLSKVGARDKTGPVYWEKADCDLGAKVWDVDVDIN